MSDDRYVHDPDAFGEDASAEGGTPVEDGTSVEDATSGEDAVAENDASAESASASSDRPAERHFDWHNWLLVAALVVAFLVVPGFIIYQPVRINSFVFTYLVLPLVPAFLLGALAVWAATR